LEDEEMLGKKETATIGFLSVYALMTIVAYNSSICSTDAGRGENLGLCPDGWVSFQDAPSFKGPLVEVLESNQQHCVLRLTTYGMQKETVTVKEEIFEKLTIPKCGCTNEVGKPQLPVIRGLIEVPPDKSAVLKVKESYSFELQEFTVYPFQDPMSTSDVASDNAEFQLNYTLYCSSGYYPSRLASVSPPMKLRGHTILQLTVNPISYRPAANQLRVTEHVEIELEYRDNKNSRSIDPDRLLSPLFDQVCMTAIWNYDDSKLEKLEEQPVGYLVISNDTFHPHLDSFVDWKTSLGFNVTSIKISEINTNATDTDIFNYVRNAFHNWTTPPTYLLLVGDVECVPTHYGAISQGLPKVGVPTDHNYSCVYGDDYFPDLLVGRLSVKTVLELTSVLDKIMGYTGFFNDHMMMISGSGFEGDCDQFYELLVDEDYVVQRLYECFGNATIEKICKTIDQGQSIIFYDDHGSITCWDVSGFSNKNVRILKLVEEYKYPIILSFACLTGKYDYSESDCLGEAWMKTPHKGAVAFLGSSDIASGFWSHDLFMGFYKGIFDQYLDEFGALTVAGKLHMFNVWGHSNYTQLHFDLYNVLTDPQLNLDPYRTRDVPSEFPTIQEAINHAKTGETVYVRNGAYNEQVTVNKTLLLIGEDKANTEIVNPVSGAAVNLVADNVEVSGFAIKSNCGNVTCGIYISSDNNKISGNIIYDNGCGIKLHNCTNNLIYHNNFMNVTCHPLVDNSPDNSWDNGCEGNYWNSYNSTDLDGDGIGDTPYLFDDDNKDNYPLMNLYWNPADINKDLEVNIYDVVSACKAYGSKPSNQNWNCHCDIAKPFGVINIYDIVTLCTEYGNEFKP
jgi:parallel beta-helix repeat protein